MKLRTQRIHQAGASNREQEPLSFNNTNKDVFEKSYVKSKSSYYNTSHSLPPAEQPQHNYKTALPFKGTHSQHQTLRWNSVYKKKGREAQWKLDQSVPALDHSPHLNAEVSSICQEFKGKNVSMFKLNTLKRTFVKNNKQRKHLSDYFQRFAKDGKIGVEGLQEVVSEYGYDINDDEAKIICRLTGSNNSQLSLSQFVELMSRENVHFSTLKLEGSSGQPRQHFPERIHLIFKNKFNKLMEAFKIYRSRGEPIDQDKYNYVMTKLDVNDLVISRQERNELFHRFTNKHGHFNAEALSCAILQQQGIERPTFPPKLSDFDSNLRTQDEVQANQAKKAAYFDFKRTSNLQFQGQFFKAQQVLKEVKGLGKDGENIVSSKGGKLTRQELIHQTEKLLKSRGVNLTKEDYDCYSSYFNYNSAQQINSDDFKQCLNQTSTKAEQRFDRRVRALAPIEPCPQQRSYDEKTAVESINKVRSKNLDTQNKAIFREFDKDKDGFVSRSELQHKLKSMAILGKWQVDNLTNYIDSEGKGYVSFDQFSKKFDDSAAKTDLNYYVEEPMSKLKSHSDWLHTKKSIIKDTNTHKWNIPNKFSAWPQRLRQTDMSLIQPPSKAAQFISELNRFNSTQKHDVGQQYKQERRRIHENKIRRLGAWNQTFQQRIKVQDQAQERRCQANDYSLRLTKEVYEERCHQAL